MALKKSLILSTLTLATGLVLAACGNNASKTTSDKEEVVLATVGSTKPFSFEKDGDLTGYDIEVAKAVFKDSDAYDVTFQKTEWSTIFTGLDADKFQMGANNISYSDERAEKYLYSSPIASNPLVLIVHKDSGIQSYADIAGKRTQVVQGTATAGLLEDYNKEHAGQATQINYTNENITQTLTNLDAGKYDYKVFETQTAKTIIEEQGLDNLTILELDLTTEQKPYIYFLFAHEKKELQAYVNKRIKELHADGTLAAISKEFLGDNYTPEAADLD